MLHNPHVLLLAANDQDAARVSELLSPYVNLTRARDPAELQHIGECRYAAVFFLQSRDSNSWTGPLRWIRDRYHDVPVIVLSPTVASQECAEALEAGAFDFLVPPYGQHALLAVVEQAIASVEARSWQAGAGRAC